MKIARLLVGLALLVVFALAFRGCMRPDFTGKPAPELFASHWFNTDPLTMQGLRGKLVLLDFWALW